MHSLYCNFLLDKTVCQVAYIIICTVLIYYYYYSLDAFVGGVIGLLFAYICYRQHYPPFLHMDCHLPYASLAKAPHLISAQGDPRVLPTENATSLPLKGLTEGPL